MSDVYDRILVPTDGGDHSSAAAEQALDIADTYDARVHAVHVIDTDTSWLTVSKTEVRDAIRDIKQNTSEHVFRDIEAAATDAGIELTTSILEGRPDERILAYVDDNDIDLVVMGTHGRTGIEHRLIGSVTERVVRAAVVPVLTVGTDSEQ